MRVTVTGATGLIGSALAKALADRGDQVVALTRKAGHGRERLGNSVEVIEWSDPQQTPAPGPALDGADAVVHLLGEPVAQRWTAQAKRQIRDSRVLGTRSLVAGLKALPDSSRPRCLVSQSATGYYGPRGDQELDESAPPGDDFLANVTVEWEREALEAAADTRVVVARTGVVLAADGGALAQMLPPFRLGVGGPVAGGRQYVPWIHLDDIVGALIHCVDGELGGPVNLTAPAPATNRELSRALGRVLHRPAVMPVPAVALRLLYGEMSLIVTTGQRVIPASLRRSGYSFAYPEIEPALRDALGRSDSDS